MNLPKEYNYIGAFLTLRCNLKCSYCINLMDKSRTELIGDEVSGKEWINFFKRLKGRPNIPITFQGGEPTLYKDFYTIVNSIERPMDLLTNMQFDVYKFMAYIHPKKFMRDAPYASIRVSLHPEQMDVLETLEKVKLMKEFGYQIGVFMVDHPKWQPSLVAARRFSEDYGIDFRTKELLGMVEGQMLGTFKYPSAVHGSGGDIMGCNCRTTELLVGPNGTIHRCHSDLYNGRGGIGSILDKKFKPRYEFKACSSYGTCNPCDVKIKTNRFQIYGHTSVEIEEVHTIDKTKCPGCGGDALYNNGDYFCKKCGWNTEYE